MNNSVFQKFTIIIYALITVTYLAWRICFTLNAEQMFASVLFLFVDIVTCCSAILFVVSLWRSAAPVLPPLSSKTFSVDVFVLTYNEDCSMLETTLKHCIAMDGLHKTYLLDDGNRPEMQLLAERLGVHYLTRDNNRGAKAGNLNHAMSLTGGELIAVFDADFRPEKHFLSRLVSYFQDEKMAVVQAPQSYYNTDSFQHRRLSSGETYTDQDTFMHLVLPARNNWNAAYWIGTNALLRRKAIETTGGFPTDSVTEDVLTSIYIHSKDWKTVYVDEPLASGLAPVDISEYFVQRLRWAKGSFQILRSHNPLFQKGLSLMQRLSYFSSLSYFFEGGIKIVYYLLPAFFFLFGVIPIYPYPPFIIEMLFYFIIARLLFQSITDGRTNLIQDEIYSVIHSFIYIMAFPAFVFNKNIRFSVTPKNSRKTLFSPGLIGPIMILGFNGAAIVATVFSPHKILTWGLIGWIGLAWCLYMGGIAFTACFYCFKSLIKKTNELLT
jgi:cellulose synthase (UDP-forming)